MEGVVNEQEEDIKNSPLVETSAIRDSGSRNSKNEANSNRPLSTSGNEDSSESSGISTVATVSFQCSCGNNCSLDTFVGGECLGQLQNCFPFLDLSKLDENNKQVVVRKLACETNEMIKKFEGFKYSIFKALTDQNTSIGDVREVVLCFGKESRPMPICQEHSEQLLKIVTIAEIHSFLTAHNYITFINYQILKEIVHRLGTSEDKACMEEYLRVFSEFCKRQVFEVPKCVFQASPPPTNSIDTQIVVKVNEKAWLKAKCGSSECIFSLNEIYTIEEAIAKEIGVDPRSIFIRDVEDGCVQLSLTILTDQATPPLSAAQVDALQHLGITFAKQPNVQLSQESLDHTAAASVSPTDAPHLQGHPSDSEGPNACVRYVHDGFQKLQLHLKANPNTLCPSISLAKFQADGKIHLNKEALDLLKTLPTDKPVAVLSICGLYRSGKSFFLSRILGIDAFEVSSKMDPCTEGIWMSTIVLECNNFVVVLLDTEGTNAAQESEQFSATDVTKLLVLTTLLSSYLIFNTKGALERSHVDTLSCFSHIAKNIVLHEGSTSSDYDHEQNLQKFFPSFLWLCRDNRLEPEIECQPVSLTEYVRKKILVSNSSNSSRNKIVHTILKLFPNLECRQTPSPGKILMKDNEFLGIIDEIAKFVLTNIRPKGSFKNQVPINGPVLANLAEQYVQALNKPGATPNLELSWVEAAKIHLTDRCHTLVKEYCHEMQQRLQGRIPVEEGDLTNVQTKQPPDTLAGIHQEIYSMKFKVILSESEKLFPSTESIGHEVLSPHFEKIIVYYQNDGKIEGQLNSFAEENRQKSQNYCEELFETLCKEQDESSIIELAKLKVDYYKKAIGPAKQAVYNKETKSISGPPLNVKTETINFFIVKVTWNQPSVNPTAVRLYEVCVQKCGGITWNKYITQNSTIKEIEITVKPNTKYKIKIRGLNGMKNGQFCEAIAYQSPAGKPDKPEKLTFIIKSPTKADFYVQRLPKDKENGSPVTHVIVECSINHSEWDVVSTHREAWSLGPALRRPYKIHVDLTNHKASESKEEEFFYRVILRNKVGESEPSDPVVISTKEMYPSRVQCNIADCEIEARRVELKWQHPKYFPSSIQSFQVRSQKDHTLTNYDECMAVIEGLEPNTEYSFLVRGNNGKYNGEWCIVNIKTKSDRPNAPSKPYIKKILSHNKAELVVNQLIQREENGKPVHTVIVQRKSKSALNEGEWKEIEDARMKLDPSNRTRHNIPILIDIHLENATTDNITCYRILMENENGLSPPSEEVQVPINHLMPGPINGLKCTNVKSTSLTLEWELPYNPAAIGSYQIKVNQEQPFEVRPPTTTQYTVARLKPYTKYKIDICTLSINATQSESVTIKKRTAAAPPLKPRIESMLMHASDPTKASIRFYRLTKEEERGSPVDSVELQWSYDTGDWYDCTQWNIDQGQRTIIIEKEFDLPVAVTQAAEAQSTKSYYKIIMYSGQVRSPPSDPHVIESAHLKPGSVENLQVDPGVHSVTLTWDPPTTNSSAIINYVINCVYKNQGKLIPLPIREVSSEYTTIQFEPLKSCQTYEIEIYAKTDKCIGQKLRQEVTTKEIIFPAPQNIRPEFRQRKAVKIRWTKPPQPDSPEIPTYYRVKVYYLDNDCTKIILTKLTRGMSTVVTGLEPSTKYTVRVTSMNENGNFDPRRSTASKTIETTMSNVRRVVGGIVTAVPTLGVGPAVLAERTKQAEDEDMAETDEEYIKSGDENDEHSSDSSDSSDSRLSDSSDDELEVSLMTRDRSDCIKLFQFK